MNHQDEIENEAGVPRGVGAQLRHARERLGLTVEQVAAETRISQRHIQHLEAEEFDSLPGRTYAIGFARTVAKVVGLDQDDVAAMVRGTLNEHDPSDRDRRQTFEPGDPARAPSRSLVWFSLVAVALLLTGLFFAARLLFAPAAELPSLIEQEQAEQAARQAARQQQAGTTGQQQQAPAQGPVVFTATQGAVWVRFYDETGSRLMEKELAAGESYTVPADAKGPQLWTGRPDLLTITVGGREVPRLAQEMQTMRDVPVDAASLLARGRAAPAGSASATPRTSPTPAR